MPRCGPAATKAIGWAGSTSRRISCATSNRCRISPARYAPRNSPTCCSSAWADRAWAPRCWRQSLGSAPGYPDAARAQFHRPAAGAAFRAQHRCRAHAVHRLEQIGHDARAERAHGLFFRQARPRRSARARRPAFRRHHRSRLPTAKDRRSRKASAMSSSAFRSIGGRYSVLSNFGLVPLAATGHDPQAFLETARVMARACGPDVPAAENPGVALGLAIGVLGPSRPRQAYHHRLAVDRRLRRLGRATGRRIDRQERKGRHSRSPESRSARRRSTTRTGCSCSARCRAPGCRAGSKRSTRSNAPGSPVVRIGLAAPQISGAGILPL